MPVARFPRDLASAAAEVARHILAGSSGRAFLTRSVESLKEYVGHELSALDPNELQTLRAIYSAIKDGETSWKAVMDDKAEKDAEAKQSAKNGKVSAAKAAPKQETKMEPEQPASGDAPTPESSTPEDNDMFGD